ncbi:MAG: tetratricopeptide repeat protein [Planctomycetales bacterium]|nr:tetratricopeptide repeat protein [Planctomycetales bacterium]
MSQAVQVDIREVVLSNSSFGPNEINGVIRTINEEYSQFVVLRDAVQELELREEQTPASAVRLGVCYYLLGRYEMAANTLNRADGGALALFYQGRVSRAMDDIQGAIQFYQNAKDAGYDADVCALAIADCERQLGRSEEAMKRLDDLFGPIEQTAEYLYQRAVTVKAVRGAPTEVIALLERAVEADEHHAGALFGLARENDRHGNDESALSLYQRAVACFPAHIGSLLDLGLLYEDMGSYDRAVQCYKRILDVYPGHTRAKLFMRDAAASSADTMVDESTRRETEKLRQTLNIPVTDFELSVRSRNCLNSMGIRTLGDLTRTTEQELLQSKNFGETSLIEIREILAQKSLELGQFAHERQEPEPHYDIGNMSPDEKQLLDRPISELNLSVRARKCMARLGLTTIGELIRKTGDDLLECKNFGVTSLNEIRDRLTHHNLKLRGD